jgi:hypothetical protein
MDQMKGEMQRVGVELARAMEELHREHGSPADWFDLDIKAEVADRPSKKPKGSSKKKKTLAKSARAPSKKARTSAKKAKAPPNKKRDRR